MINSEFRPGIFHPYYFIRKGLFNKIRQYSPMLKGKLLDFGCGSKPYRSYIQADEYVGVDFENEGHPHDNEEIDIFYDGKRIPVEAELFDSVLSSEVFEHIFNLEEMLVELHRVMKPGATILITCPFVWKEHEVPNDYARYTQFALKHLFEKNGFKIKVQDKSGNFMEVLSQLQVLYFHDSLYLKFFVKIPVARELFRLFFFALPNLGGLVLSSLFPKNKRMYLNNIIVAEKC